MKENGKLLKLTSIAQNLKVEGTILVINTIEERMYQYLDDVYGTPEDTPIEVVELNAIVQGILDHMKEHAEASKLAEVPNFNMAEIKVYVPNDAIIEEECDGK